MCDACPYAQVCADVMTPRGQVSHEPRGRKPRHAPMPFGEAKPLWGFDGLQSRAMATPVDESGDDIAPLRYGDKAKPAAAMMRRPRKHGLAR